MRFGPIIRLARCESTNDEAFERAAAGAGPGTVIVADAQTRGRGRLGRSWHAPPGENLTASFILAAPAHPVPALTLAAGLAVAQAVERFGVSARLKWPNDVLVSGRKLAGLLAEMRTQGTRTSAVVLGLGLNVNTRDFPAELPATSLARETGEAFELGAVLEALFEPLSRWFEQFEQGGVPAIADAWQDRALLGPVTYETASGPAHGVARGLAEDGGLRVQQSDGSLHVLHSGCVFMNATS